MADFFKAEGSSGDNPVFNGLNLTSTYPGGIASGDQQDAYERLSNILTTYGKRVLTAYRIYLVPDKASNLVISILPFNIRIVPEMHMWGYGGIR